MDSLSSETKGIALLFLSGVAVGVAMWAWPEWRSYTSGLGMGVAWVLGSHYGTEAARG